ncbi:MAG: cache domain-containing protein [Deltaproteobacteria bacterium]|nr:cache domain-containing protein [Deltaproteobacteria bacterium]
MPSIRCSCCTHGLMLAGLLLAAQAVAAPREGQDTPAAQPQLDAQVTLNNLRALAEWRLRAVARMLSMIANAPEAQTGEWEPMRGLLLSMGDTGILANAIWLVRPDGSYYTVEKGLTGSSLADRPYFPALMNGRSVMGTLVISRSTGKRSVIIAEPIKKESRVIGGVGVSYSVDALSKEIDEAMGLPAGVVFYALDPAGQAALHRDPSLMFAYPSDLGEESLRSAVATMRSKDTGTVDYVFRGTQKRVLFQKSKTLGWIFALGFSEPVAKPIR